MNPNNVAVVAGGTAGIGRVIVDALIKDGYKVGILARGKPRLDELAQEYGDRVLTLSCDVGEASAVARAGATVEEALGPIDVWVNCAMATSFSPFPLMTPEEFDTILQTTFIGVVNGTRTALSFMEKRNKGRIVTVGSGLAYRSVPYQSAYCAAKHAINGFADSIRSELLREGSAITMGVVQMPAVNTPQFDWARNRLSKKPQPAPPVYQPQVAAKAVMRAIRKGEREIFVGKSVLQLVFGHLIAPGWLDHKLADSGAEQQKSEENEPGDRPDNLHEPVNQIGATARGRFDDNASDTGLIVNATHARLALFAGVPLLAFGIGLVLG